MANNEAYTLYLIGEDGKTYKVPQAKWQNPEYLITDPNDPSGPPIQQALTFGTLLANMNQLGIGIGMACVFTNVKSVASTVAAAKPASGPK
jgi:hypothetical protein